MVIGTIMSGIFQRIGEAIASQGKITLVAALNDEEANILMGAGFKKAGTMDLNGSLVDLYEVKVQQIINTTQPYQIARDIFDKPRKYEQQWPENYRMYSIGTGTGQAAHLNFKGNTTSLMDAAYDPLSILEDYFFPRKEEETHREFKIEVDDMDEESKNDFIQKVKDEFHKSGRTYCDDSWTSYNVNYSGNTDHRNW
ncbi:hypothetical protein 7t3_0466 [Salmonella phage 7t3]|nr:hypothetical protein 7t3_0466 [Salmonella phage 7t3]